MRLIRPLTLSLLGVLASGTWHLLPAQCPDGTPPPCRIALAAGARRDPPLDDRTWLILPFDNTANAADADLVRQASVSLLYQELSRWSDLHVISDDRVADLLRGAGQARLGLEASLAVARRAGAGRLIIGDYLALGGTAQVAAKVYDVRSGRLVRTVRDRLAGLQSAGGIDSLTTTFARLARSALSVPAPPGTRLVGVGTSSLAAYSAYAAGMAQYRNGFRDSAFVSFGRALAIDSTYPLPRLRLFHLGVPDGRQQLERAGRFADSLPPRERALLTGYRAFAAAQFERVCATAAELLRADSADAEAWVMAGACEEDPLVSETPAGPHFVRSLNRAIANYQKALELDPAQPIAFARLNLLLGETLFTRIGCAGRAPCPAGHLYWGPYLIVSDTIAVRLQPLAGIVTRSVARSSDVRSVLRWRTELRRRIVERYALANPGSVTGHANYADALLKLGNLGGAERELNAAAYAAQIPGDRRLYYRDRIEIALRRERPSEAAAYLDSMLVDSTAVQQPQYATAFGRFTRDQAAQPESLRVAAYAARAAWTPIFAGIVPPDLDSIEQRAARFGPPRNAQGRASLLRLSTIVAFHGRRTGPMLDTSASEHELVRAQSFIATGHATRARQLLEQNTDSIASLPPDALDHAEWLIAAELWLTLGDTARALSLMQDWARRWPTFSHNFGSLLEQVSGATAAARLYPRAWLLFGDLSLAAGRRDDARRAYRMVIGMWEGGEAPVQPIVARVRAALASLGN